MSVLMLKDNRGGMRTVILQNSIHLSPNILGQAADPVVFCVLLRESVLEGAKNVLGEALAMRVLAYVRLDTVANMLEIGTIVRSMCGNLGAAIVERVIVKELFERLNIRYEEGYGLDLVESLQLLLADSNQGTSQTDGTIRFGSR